MINIHSASLVQKRTVDPSIPWGYDIYNEVPAAKL
jgi:hypothetical protein